MNEYDEDQHDTPPMKNYENDPFVVPNIAQREGLNRVAVFEPPQIELSHGLTWTFTPGHKLIDLGRILPDTIEALHTLDLRVILAHLDSAATAIKTELDRRYR